MSPSLRISQSLSLPIDVTAMASAIFGIRNNLSALRSLGLLDYPSDGKAVATKMLFPEGLK